MKRERKKQVVQLAIWTWTWVVTLALATFGPKYLWNENSALTILAIILNLLNGVLMILANRTLFNHYDELERKIHLESMGFTLGIAVIVGLSYSVLEQSSLIPFDAEISLLVGFIGITYMVTLLINRNRYS